MYSDVIQLVSTAAQKKSDFLKNNPLKYLVSTVLAGAYIGFGIVLVYTIGGDFAAVNSPFTKLLMGLFFGTALSLIVMAGAELFTGNAMVTSIGIFQKSISFRSAAAILLFCYVGNLIGSALLSYLMTAGQIYSANAASFILSTASAKMSAPFIKLFFAGILCNILVCLPIWCGYRMKSESGKLVMIFCGILMFVTPGFEHCIANMTLLSSALMLPHDATITLSGFFYNVLSSGLGNLVGGGIVIGGGYYFISKK